MEPVFPSRGLPLHVVTLLLQFAIPEIMSIGEARVLCRGTAAALASPSFWRGMTITLGRDEGFQPAPNAVESGGSDRRSGCGRAGNASLSRSSFAFSSSARDGDASSRGPVAGATGRPRSNAECLGISKNSSSKSGGVGGASSPRASCADAEARDGNAAPPTRGCSDDGAPDDEEGKRCRTSAGGDHVRRTIAGPAAPAAASGKGRRGQGMEWGVAAKTFLRRYYHHVAFRRLTPPVTDTEAVKMPVTPMYPTCLDVRGCMVAVGTREGPVLLFDVGPRLPRETAAAAAAVRPPSTVSCTSSGGGGGTREDSGISAASGTRVYRVYGSLADGTGPVSSVLLDRAKVIAAGRGSRRSGGGYVIRIYAVDSTRLLRTLRCLGEVSRMCLFDPVLAVLSSASGRISFRDLYADKGSGLGQSTATGLAAAAFVAVEPSTTISARPGNDDHNDHGGGSSSGVVLHCVDPSGGVFEASTSGASWNLERGNNDGGGITPSARAVGRGWHLCADLGASLLVRASPTGNISGWRLHPTGRRARGRLFTFRLPGSSPAASPPATTTTVSPTARPLTSASLTGGGLILATATEGGGGPRLWDLRLTRRRSPPRKWVLASSFSGDEDQGERGVTVEAAAGPGGGTPGGSGGGAGAAGGGPAAAAAGSNQARQQPGVAASNEVGVGGGAARGVRPGGDGGGAPRNVCVRPWPVGVWAVAAAVTGGGGGRVVSACSDGCLRVAQLRPNNVEPRLRAAVLKARRTRQDASRQVLVGRGPAS